MSYVEIINDDPTSSNQPTGKRVQMTAPTKFDGVVIPKVTWKSAHITKGTTKPEITEIYHRLGQELATVAKTFDEMADLVE